MSFYRYFTKNNAQGVVINDTSSQITFQAGHTIPTNVTSGEFLLTLGGPGGEIVKVTSASQDGFGVLTVGVTRAQENSSYLDATSGTVGYLYLTAGMFNKAYDILEEHETKLNYMTITQAVNLDTLESDTATNNAKVTNAAHTGDVTGSGVLGIVPAAISGRTGVTPVSGDYLLLWDATDSTLKKADASNFLGGGGGGTGDVTGPASSTDSGIAIFNGTDGKTIKNSLVTIDTSSINIPGFLTITGQARFSQQTTLSSSGIITWNINNDPKAKIILSGDVTSFTISGININSEASIYIKQDSTSAYTIDWPGTITWVGSVEPNISTLDSKHIISLYSYDGTNLFASHISDDISTVVTSVNSFTGAVTLVTGNISDTTSTQKYATSAQLAKVDYISVTQAVDLDTLESDTATNNAKVTNATHTGDVTGSGVLGIVPAAISGRTGVTPVSGDYLLLWDATDSALKKVDASNFLGGAVSSVNTFTGAVVLVTDNISDTTSTNKWSTAAEKAKLGFISVTQAVDLDTMESNITTNNAKVTNANHTGDVTGADVLGIVPAAISGKTGVTPVSGDYVLLWDATDSTLKKADVSNFLGGGGTGDVTGPASSTDSGIAIFDGTGGKTIKNSLITIDTTSITIPGFLSITGQARNTAQTALSTSGIIAWNLNNDPKANIILAGDVTSLTFSGINLNTEGTLYIQQNDSTAYDIDWPLSLVWANGSTPDISELSSKHIVSFYSYDGTGLIGAYISSTFSSGGGAVDSVNTFTGAVTLVTGNISDTTSTQKYTTAADITKMSYISVTQAVDLDTIESDTATNNAKVTNAAHTGDVTGSGVLGIVPAAISGRTSVTPVATDYLLLWDATDSLLKKCDASNFLSAGAGGDVTGPASSTNTGIAIFNGTGGKTLMNSLVTIDTTSVTIPGFLTVTGQTRQSTQTSLTTTGSFTWNINNNPAAQINALSGDVTLTISGIAINANAILYVKQHASAAKTITWPGTVVWSGGYAPDLSTVGSDHFISFYSYDGTGLIASHATTQNMSTLQSTSGSTVTGAIAIWDGTSGTTVKDTTSMVDVSGNFTNVLSINGTTFSTLVSDVAANTAKVTNANHTGDVTGSGVLGIVPAAISGRTSVTPVATDYVLLWDATDSLLKKADVAAFLGTGDVTGPASSTNTGIAIFNGTGGKTLMNSLVTIDTSSVTVPGFLTITGQARHANQTALSTSGAVTWNLNNDPKAKIILSGDVTGITLSGINLNTEATLYIKQHASSAKVITWPAGIIWAGNTEPVISTLNSNHVITFYSYDGTGLFGAHISDMTSAFTSNVTHTGDVTGADVLGIVPAAISGRTSVTPVSGDYVLLWDATDSLLKKANVSDFISAITASSTTTFTNKRITKRVAAISDGTGLDINCDNYDSGYVVLAGNRTLNYFTGTPTNHQQLMIEFIQDATGSRTVTLKDTTGIGSFRVGADVTGLVLSTAAGKNDFVLFTYSSDLTGWALTAITKTY